MVLTNLNSQNKTTKDPSIKYRAYAALMSSVDVDNFPSAVKAVVSENPLKADAKWNHIDFLAGSINPTTAPGESPSSQKLTIAASVEGISEEVLDWFYSVNGERIIFVWERCSDGKKFIAGSPCSGGLLVSGTIGELDNKFRGLKLTLTGADCPEPFWVYTGELPVEE
ncbi:MAG: hypothetical protein QM654_16475 [Dysgonamonadaceae bacterium]